MRSTRTSQGAATGLASLRHACHAAGVRLVLAMLWKAGDETAQLRMADFYDRSCKQKQGAHTALCGATKAARERGAPFRGWAGWLWTER